MSYYYSYYLGLKTKDGLIYPIGPFDLNEKIHPIIERSHSFVPGEMTDNFITIPDESITQELKDVFSYITNDDVFENNSLSYEKLSDLPKGDGLKAGYFLISDVKDYKNGADIDDVFYDYMTPEEYLYKSQNEIKFGGPKKEVDEFGNNVTPHSCADYMPFAYIDWLSAEYMAERIRNVANIYDSYGDEYEDKYGKDYELVVLMTQG